MFRLVAPSGRRSTARGAARTPSPVARAACRIAAAGASVALRAARAGTAAPGVTGPDAPRVPSALARSLTARTGARCGPFQPRRGPLRPRRGPNLPRRPGPPAPRPVASPAAARCQHRRGRVPSAPPVYLGPTGTRRGPSRPRRGPFRPRHGLLQPAAARCGPAARRTRRGRRPTRHRPDRSRRRPARPPRRRAGTAAARSARPPPEPARLRPNRPAAPEPLATDPTGPRAQARWPARSCWPARNRAPGQCRGLPGRGLRRHARRHRRGLSRRYGAAALPPSRSTFRACQQGRHHHNMQGHSKKLGAASAKRPPAKYVRRRPTLPRGPPRSTIGAEGLNFRVRNGTGCFPFAMATETLWRCGAPTASREPHSGRVHTGLESPPRPGVVEAKPLGLLVPVSSTCCHASTSGLSTQSSSWGPYRVNPEGDLILRRASRLDAFSGYPFRT